MYWILKQYVFLVKSGEKELIIRVGVFLNPLYTLFIYNLGDTYFSLYRSRTKMHFQIYVKFWRFLYLKFSFIKVIISLEGKIIIFWINKLDFWLLIGSSIRGICIIILILVFIYHEREFSLAFNFMNEWLIFKVNI